MKSKIQKNINAVIFAAGQGTRMFPITKNTPKPLIKVFGKSFIERSIIHLIKAGITDITVVVGYKKESFIPLKNKYPFINIVENLDYLTSNNISSLVYSKKFFKNTIYVEGDLYIRKNIFEDIIKKIDDHSIAFGKKIKKNINEWKYNLDQNRNVIDHSSPAVSGDYIWSGILYVDEKTSKEIVVKIDKYYLTNKQDYFETFLWTLENKFKLETLDESDLVEIDTYEELCSLDESYRTHTGLKLFTPGPTNIPEVLKKELASGIVHHRSKLAEYYIAENLRMMKKVFDANNGFIVPLTASGTAAMEMGMINSTCKSDNLLVLSNGDFGDRLIEIADVHFENVTTYKEVQEFNINKVEEYIILNKINVLWMIHHETSTGRLNDIKAIAKICKKHNVIIGVDTISSIVYDKLEFDNWGIDIALASSPKAFQLPPGMSWLCFSKKVLDKIDKFDAQSFYFNLKKYVEYISKYNQTPFTPGISLLVAANKSIDNILLTGVDKIRDNALKMKNILWSTLKTLGYKKVVSKESNSILSVYVPKNTTSKKIKEYLIRNGYYIAIGRHEYADKVIRFGLIGTINEEDCHNVSKLLVNLHKI